MDVENLLAGGHVGAGAAEVARAVAAYAEAVGQRAGDLAFYGANPALHFVVRSTVRGGRVVGHSGRDGADRALLEEAAVDWVAERFTRVCIGSGDHAFAPLAAELRSRGVHVVVAAHVGELSADLYRASSEHVTLARTDLVAA